tara:strand:- start:283 stop:441 length:159 start_codon:yes stop_codon:yes gene_type:complete
MKGPQNIAECKEQIQQDLLSFLDGLGDDVLEHVCEIVIKNFKTLEQKLEAAE